MMWTDLLQARWQDGRARISAVSESAFTEGSVHERARLFDGVRFMWWRRSAKRLSAKVLDETRTHEVTARNARLTVTSEAMLAWDTMLRDAQVAVTALDRIAAGKSPDPTEIASQALDVLRGSMARFGFANAPVVRIEIGANTVGFAVGVEAAQHSIEDIIRRSMNTAPRDLAMPDDA